MIAIVDCNNFYVSCERVFRPDLKNKPVVVLSNNDGCIISRSEEAKTLGIKMGQAAFEIESFLYNNNVTVFSSNYALYGDLSQRVMNIISELSPEVEVYSIDEAFIDFSCLQTEDIIKICEQIIRNVKKWTGIPVSIGISKTKTLAKIANKFCKKNKIKSGCLLLETEEDIVNILQKTKITDVWGIGRRYAKMLRSNFIYTAFDFTTLSDSFIRKKMTVVGLRTKKELLGEKCIFMEKAIPNKKTIATTRSFGKLLDNIDDIRQAVSTFANICAMKLRKQKSAAKYIMVFIHTNYYRKDLPQYAKNRVLTFSTPTNSSIELIKYSIIALNDIFAKGYKFKKIGVVVTGLVNEKNIQYNLFDTKNHEKEKKLMKVIDKFNTSFNKNIINIGYSNSGEKWRLRQEKLSQSYTTNWNEILEIKI